jgi:hypothetical protein
MLDSPFSSGLPLITTLLIFLGTLGFFHVALSFCAGFMGIEMTEAQCATIVGVSGLASLVPFIGPILCVMVAIFLLCRMCEAQLSQAFWTIILVRVAAQLLLIGLVSFFSTH